LAAARRFGAAIVTRPLLCRAQSAWLVLVAFRLNEGYILMACDAIPWLGACLSFV
jgi:hypothetical protein